MGIVCVLVLDRTLVRECILVLIHVLFQPDLSTLDGVNRRVDVAQYVSTVS